MLRHLGQTEAGRRHRGRAVTLDLAAGPRVRTTTQIGDALAAAVA